MTATAMTTVVGRRDNRNARSSRRRLLLCQVLLCVVLPSLAILQANADPATPSVDSSWILAKLARPAPMSTPFVEVRDSPMLKTPLRIQGLYSRPDADTLVREVRAPYAETTTIRAGEASIVRNGRSPRRFSLSRVPELAGLQASFGALLSGDSELLARTYRVTSSGTRQRWTLTMVPKDARLAERVRDIVLHGRGAELRCIETTPAKGDVQRTLLASAARAATQVTDAGTMTALCRQDNGNPG